MSNLNSIIMKSVKRISCILFLGVIITVFSSNMKATQLPEVEIVCSAGNYGRCFNEYTNWYTYDSVVKFECKWTGFHKDYCSILFIKVSNIAYDYFL